MKKKMISALLCVIFTGIPLAGCGTSNTPDTAKTTAPADEAEASISSNENDANVSSNGETYQLTVTSHDPRTSATGEFLEKWAASVKEASDGRLVVLVHHNASMADENESYDYVLEGKTDIAWGLQSTYADVFPVTGVFSLPMLDIDNAVQGSEALWKFYSETDFMDEEYAPFHVLLLHTNCQSPISTVTKRIETVDELASMQIRANGGPASLLVQNLGTEPVTIPITDLYSALGRGACNAAITDWHAIRSFALNGVCNHFLDENIGVSTYFMLMNKDSYNNLPADLQKILDETSTAAIQYTDIWNDYEKEVRKLITDVDPHAIYKLNSEEKEKLQTAAAQTAEQWIQEMNDKGFDGQAIYDKAVECIESVK